jgi:small subunit ribosomal protein S2
MLSLANLYQLGAHRGNSKSKLNPKLKSKVHSYNNNLCTIDLVSTIDSISKVKELFQKLGQKKKQILIVGTSSHISGKIPEYSQKFTNSTMPYVNVRWLGGTLTNWLTIKKNLKILEKLENIKSDEKFFATLARNEQLRIARKIGKMAKFFDGLKALKTNRPGAILILDAGQNDIAIKEAELIGVPVVCLTNTFIQTLPKNSEYTILCNNNSISAIDFIIDELTGSFNKGLASANEMMQKEKETRLAQKEVKQTA